MDYSKLNSELALKEKISLAIVLIVGVLVT